MALLTEFPIARSDSVMVVRDGKLILWGGYTQITLGEGDDRFIVAINLPDPDSKDRSLEVCDLETMEWRRQQTYGSSFPIFGKGAFSAASKDHIYVFGGLDDVDYRNQLFQLNLEDFSWKELTKVGSPSPRAYGGMVVHGECVIVFGGIGTSSLHASEKGAKTIKDDKFGGEIINEWNNSIHEYNTVTGKWRELSCSGARPPPLERFSFDKIDQRRALLFGGKRGLFTAGFHFIYVLDLESMEWKGPIGPSSPDQIWPQARGVHATSCVVDPELEVAAEHQQILVVWGEGLEAIHLSDIWLLNVPDMTWKEIGLSLMPRKYHMCASNFVRERQTDIVVYGGNKRRKNKYERNVMTDMIIFRFGTVRELQDICINFIKQNLDLYEQVVPSLPVTIRQRLGNENSFYYPYEFINDFS